MMSFMPAVLASDHHFGQHVEGGAKNDKTHEMMHDFDGFVRLEVGGSHRNPPKASL